MGNLSGDLLQSSINWVLDALSGKNATDMLPTPSWKWSSMESQQFRVLHLSQSNLELVANIQKWDTARL